MIKVFQFGPEKEREEYMEWLGLEKKENRDERRFNLREINRRLCLLE